MIPIENTHVSKAASDHPGNMMRTWRQFCLQIEKTLENDCYMIQFRGRIFHQLSMMEKLMRFSGYSRGKRPEEMTANCFH